MKSNITKGNLSLETTLLCLFVFAMLVFPEVSFAADGSNSQSSNFKNFITTGAFKTAIDLGLLFSAAYKWFSYFINWNPANAFLEVIVPGLITFLAFNWLTVLGWVGLGGAA